MGICELFDDSNICQGCFRTIQEITNWVNSSENEKLDILDRIEKRKQFYLEFCNDNG